MTSSLVSESAIKKLIYNDNNTVEKTKKMIETILQELVVDTNPLNLVIYLNVLTDYMTKNGTNREVCSQIIRPIFTIALGDEINGDTKDKDNNNNIKNPSTSTSTIFWIGSIRLASQHNNYLVRTSSAQLLGTLLLLCAENHTEYKQLLSLVSPILQHLVNDSNKNVSRKAAVYFSKIHKTHYSFIQFRNEFFTSLLSLHGGQGNSNLSSKEDRHYIYNILIHCQLPNFHIFCIIVTFLQNYVLRLQSNEKQLEMLSSSSNVASGADVSSIVSQNEMDICKCLHIIKSNHVHFNNVFEMSLRVRHHSHYGHLPTNHNINNDNDNDNDDNKNNSNDNDNDNTNEDANNATAFTSNDAQLATAMPAAAN